MILRRNVPQAAILPSPNASPNGSRRRKTNGPTGRLSSEVDMSGTSRHNSEESHKAALLVLGENIKYNRGTTKYRTDCSELLHQEEESSWCAEAKSSATAKEHHAQQIIFKIREHERIDPGLFGNLAGEAVPASTSRDMGGMFLPNLKRIENSRLFDIARQIPKGGHQHLHFNSAIRPEQLFPHARSPEMQETMFIRSTLPLTNATAYNKCEIVFNVFPRDTTSANIFSKAYNPDVKDPNNAPWMLWRNFRKSFRSRSAPSSPQDLEPAERWARDKVMVTENQAYGQTATHNSIWACFNQGTRAFKGLVAYEGAYRWYIGHAIDSMIRDKIMYAELRPMLLDKSMPSNDGLRKIDHREQMQIICDEVAKKRRELEARNELEKFPFGLKIIYCTPRSIPLARMKSELADCIKLKLEFPDLICGFDLVGAEDRPNCIRFYADLLLAFQATCEELKISIPFMFHAGETLLDTGGSSNPENSNLYDALLLHAKRIGHGYAILKHPVLVEKYKENNICLELCPISNELLHLCGNAREHPFPQLLAAGLHCTLNADNPSSFR